ncbi:MAG: AsmA family protein, partial [Deltaproteobacteria bacterium]|nr:AsmA family protein [Deltaproteobacteria bacterium]
ARFTGSIQNLIKGKGLAITVTGTGPSIPEILKQYNITYIPDLGPFAVTAKLTDPDGMLGLTDIDLKVGGEDKVRARFTGPIQNLIKGKGPSITVTGTGPSIPELLKQYNITYIPDLRPFDVRSKLTDPDGRLGLTDIDLKVGGEDRVQARFTGSIQNLIKGKGLAITVTGTGPSIPELLKQYNITYIPDLGPFDVRAKLTDPDGRLGLTDIDLKVGNEEMVKTRFMGTVENITAIKGMNLNFDIQGKDLANLKKITGKPMPLSGPFSVSGNAVALSEKSYKISGLKALIQESDVNGSLEINLEGKTPRITADLCSEKLDLRPLLPKKGSKTGEPEKDSDELPARKDKVFSDTLLPLEALKQMDAEIELKAKQLLLPLLFLSDTTAHVVLEDGHLTVEPLNLVMGGGTLDGHFDLNVQGKAAQMATALKIDQYELGSMLKKLGINDSLHGNVDIELNLKGRGNSIAELMSGLNGKTMVIMGDGRINQNAVKLLGSDLSSGLLQLFNPLKKEEKYTKINCFAGGFDIKNGLAQSTVLAMDTSQVSVVGYGKIDLKTEEIDLSFKPSPKKGIGIDSLAKFTLSFGELTKTLKLKGTLSNPSLSVDPTGSIITLGKAVGGVVLFGPFGIAAVLANGQLGGKNPCLAIIEAAKKEFQKPEAEKSEEKKSVIEKTTKDIDNGPKKLLGQ